MRSLFSSEQLMPYEKTTFGAGCFWGVEASFAALPGVVDTAAGYAGGDTQQPTYEQVCSGGTGHAEVVEVTYNPAKTSYSDLLDAFFAMHNPAQPYRRTATEGRPGRDQYRSAIFTHSDEQALKAHARLTALNSSGVYPDGIATEILPALTFWRAEERHQQYFAKRNIKP